MQTMSSRDPRALGKPRQQISGTSKIKGVFLAAISFAVLVLTVSTSAQDKIERKKLFKTKIGAQTIATVDVREIVFKPGQKTGRHRHPCPVIGYIVEGTVLFQVEGQKLQVLHAGEVCYEPANTVIERFDVSDEGPAKVIPYYLLNGQKELIEMLPPNGGEIKGETKPLPKTENKTMKTESTPITGKEEKGSLSEPLQALSEFYAAFNGKDLDKMSRNWAQTDEAVMDNPVGGIKRGWDDIKSVYAKIFRSPATVTVEFYDYTLHEAGEIFYVVGRERGELKTKETTIPLEIRTTRIFRMIDGQWRQVHHHGSMDDPALLARYQQAVKG